MVRRTNIFSSKRGTGTKSISIRFGRQPVGWRLFVKKTGTIQVTCKSSFTETKRTTRVVPRRFSEALAVN